MALISWLLTIVDPVPLAKTPFPSGSLGVGTPSSVWVTPVWETMRYENPAGRARSFAGSGTSGP